MAAYRPRVHGDVGHRVARMATRACRRAATVRLARERDVAGSHATRRAAGLERRERLGVHTGRPPGSGAVRHLGAGGMTVAVVLHEPQDLVNIAHVVRALKNFGFRDLRLVSPREYDPYRVEGIPRQHVLRLVRDALDTLRVVLARAPQPEVAKPEILERPHHVSDVDEVLGLVQNDGDGHPTSSKIPNRSGSCRSPRINTQPLPPLQTSCPARRVRPGNISFTSKSNRSRPPTCARCHSGHAMPNVTVYPRSVRRHAPRTPPGSADVSLVARTRSPVAPVSGTTRYPTRPSPPSPATYTCRPSE